MKKKYQSGGSLYKGYPKPEQRPVIIIKQGYKGAPTMESVREGKRLEERQNYEKGVTRVKAGLAAASNIPYIGKSAQALGIGADLGAGIAKTIRGEKGASKDFAQAGVGTAALMSPKKGLSVKGLKRGVAFFKAAELGNDANDILEGAITYKKGGKMPQKKLSYEDWKKKYNKRETSDYKLREAYDLGYTPDKKGHLPTVNDKTGEFLKSSKHPTVKEELKWYKSKDGASFRAKHDIDSSGEYWKYVPKLKEGGKMPLKKASGKGKPAVQKAVSANIQELTRANREKPAGKKRSKEQIAAIAYSAARKK